MTIDNNITNLTQNSIPSGVNPTAQAGQTGQTTVKSHPGDPPYHDGGDRVQLSDFASHLSAQASSTDPAKLARLQAAYNSGTYNVPPSQIANSIIADALSN
jgi:anti-sigma28 factor (negative regulator of flagellin synthesis)